MADQNHGIQMHHWASVAESLSMTATLDALPPTREHVAERQWLASRPMEQTTMKKRDVDWVIEFIDNSIRINPVVKQALINRLDKPLTRDEIDRARHQLQEFANEA